MDLDAIVVEKGHAGGFVESLREPLQFGTDLGAEQIALFDDPAKTKFWRELISSVDGLLQIAVFLKSEQNPEERRFWKSGADADFLESKWRLAVEAIENFECAADGAQVILLVRGCVVGVKRPLGNAAAWRFFRGRR